jgi:hypothetical protein
MLTKVRDLGMPLLSVKQLHSNSNEGDKRMNATHSAAISKTACPATTRVSDWRRRLNLQALPGGFFPEFTFLQLLFGWRAREEIEAAFPDCRTRGDEPPVLIDILFPKLPSHVLI